MIYNSGLSKYSILLGLGVFLIISTIPKRADATLTLVESVRGYNGSIKTWTGKTTPGATVTITYTPIGGGAKKTVTSTPAANNGDYEIDQPADVARPQFISGVSTDGCRNGRRIALGNVINQGLVNTEHTILAGSTANIGNDVFSLTGQFITRPSFYDDDINSPNYGNLEALINPNELLLVGTSSIGNISFLLDSPVNISLNLVPILPIALGGNGDSSLIIDPINISGTIETDFVSNGIFSGDISGILFPDDLSSNMNLNLNLNSSFGIISGDIFTSGETNIEVIPEPSHILALLTFSTLGISSSLVHSTKQKRLEK